MSPGRSAEKGPVLLRRQTTTSRGLRHPALHVGVQLTHDIARGGRYEGAFLLVWCQTAPRYGAAGIAQHRLRDAQSWSRWLCFAETSHQKKYTNKSRRLCPVEFVVVRVALVTTTCGEVPTGWRSRSHKPLCGAKQGPQGFVAEPKKPATFPAHRCQFHVRKDLSSWGSENVPSKSPSFDRLDQRQTSCLLWEWTEPPRL